MYGKASLFWPRGLWAYLRVVLVVAILSVPLSAFVSASIAYVGPEPGVARTLTGVARPLGWQDNTMPFPDIPGQAFGIVHIETDGTQSIAIAVMEHLDGPTMLDLLADQGMTRGVFRGRNAIIAHPGDPVDGIGTAVRDKGVIAWECGPYVFIVRDTTGTGQEQYLALVLEEVVAEQTNLCGIGSTIVILADTLDTPGKMRVASAEVQAEEVSLYYRCNGYGRVDFTFAFMDADGDKGDHDWYHVGSTVGDYCDNEQGYAIAAVQAAGADLDLPPVAYLNRAIVIHPVFANLDRSHWANQCVWYDGYIAVSTAKGTSRLYVMNILLLSEDSMARSWAHEIGHTIHSRHEINGLYRLGDRYNAPDPALRYGNVWYWGVMGYGSVWQGRPDAPTHMTSYTKEAAGWLRYVSAEFGQDYTLQALEHQRMGDEVLVFTPPRGDDATEYYIIEARDSDVPFGAPYTGVVIYHVKRHPIFGFDVVDALVYRDLDGCLDPIDSLPTLWGVGQPDGVTRFTNVEAGFRVWLLGESFGPYSPTIRIERLAEDTPDL